MFFEKSYAKCNRDTISRPFSKTSKLSMSLDKFSKVSNSLSLWYAKLRTIRTHWNQAADHLLLAHIKLFLITKDVKLVSLPHFLHKYLKKYFSFYTLLPGFIVWLPLLREVLCNICNCLLTRLWCHNFEINHMFLTSSYICL